MTNISVLYSLYDCGITYLPQIDLKKILGIIKASTIQLRVCRSR